MNIQLILDISSLAIQAVLIAGGLTCAATMLSFSLIKIFTSRG